MYEKGYRTVSYSRTEATHSLRYPDINGMNRLFGGRLLEWIDEIAGIAAMRHAGMNVATVSIEHLEFKKGAYLNDTLVMIAYVTHVGRTSIEVRVDTWIEDRETGMRRPMPASSETLVFPVFRIMAPAARKSVSLTSEWKTTWSTAPVNATGCSTDRPKST